VLCPAFTFFSTADEVLSIPIYGELTSAQRAEVTMAMAEWLG
jgi:hypothetical protein